MSPRTAAGVQSDLTTLPHRVPASGLLLPPEWQPLARMVPDLVHRSGVIQAAIHHHPADRIAVLDVFERIPVEHDEIGKLAFLEGSDVVVEAEIASAVDRTARQRFERRHAALREHPQLPVGAEPLQLAMSAELDVSAGIADGLRALRDTDVVEVVVGGHRTTA